METVEARAMETHPLQPLAHHQGVPAPSAGEPAQAVMGVLTRPLFRSPVTKLILPARIRHQDLNDVIFVRGGSVEIKIYRDGCLQHVAIKDDFGAMIRAARVIGQPRDPVGKVELPGVEQILRQTKAEKLRSDRMDIDHVFQSPKLPDLPSPPPPQILALTLQSSREDTLVFVSASQQSPDQTRFVSSHVPLPTTRSGAVGRLGKYIAVDPRSRAMAVAASYGSFVVYALKPMNLLHREVRSPDGSYAAGFMPIREERHMSIDGWILKIEFLYPSKKDLNHVILLVVTRIDGKTRFVRYEWDCSKELRDLRQTDIQSAGPDEQCPLLLIPFSINTGFILVFENTMALYLNILNFPMRSKSQPLGPEPGPLEPGSSRKDPLWTAWARPLRRSDYAEKHDDFYLCREDGTVHFLEINGSTLNWGLTVSHPAGQLLVNISTAFAVLDNEWDCVESSDRGESNGIDSSYDVLAATGDMSNGKVVLMKPRLEADVKQTVPNWTPMLDFCTLPPKPSNSLGSVRTALSERERIFGCMGRGTYHGAICELRSGMEAQIRIKFPIEGLTVTGMWILPDVSGSANGICMLVTDIDNSLHLLHISPNEVEDLSDPEDLFGISFEFNTIAAGSTVSGIIIQITQHSMRAFLPGRMDPCVSQLEGRVRSACIDGHHSAVIAATEYNGETSLHYGQYYVTHGHVRFSGLLKSNTQSIRETEPSCLFLNEINNQMFAFVGTVDGRLTIFNANGTEGLVPQLTHRFDGDFAVCESMVVLCRKVHVETDDRFLLLCGLRNGSLQSFFVRTDGPGKLSLRSCEVLNFGTTRVTVVPDKGTSKAPWYVSYGAFVLCGSNLVYLTYNSNQRGSDTALVRSIFLVDATAPEFCQPSLSVIAQSDPWDSNHGSYSRYLFCADPTMVYGTELGTWREPYAVIRRMPISGTPSKIMYSSQLHKLVVSYTTLRTKPWRRSNASPSKKSTRFLFPTLVFLDPDEHLPEIDDHTINRPKETRLTRGQMLPGRTPRVIGFAGVKILGLTQWTPQVLGDTYLLLAVSCLEVKGDGRSDTGAIYLYNVVRDAGGQVSLNLKKSIPSPDPVYSIATYDTDSLIYTSGLHVSVLTVTIVNREPKFLPPVTCTLRSRGLSVSAQKPYIYVSTAKHSLMVFQFEANEFMHVFSDGEAREGLNHISLLSSSLVLASNRPGPNHPSTKVVGFSHISTPLINNSTRTMFEIVLPGSIRKFCKANIRAPWFSGRGRSADIILGGCSDGSFYSFEFLDEPKWRLLRFLQNLCERTAAICPSAVYLRQHRQRIEPAGIAQDKHIDGDILLRVLERGMPGPASLIRSMLMEIPGSYTQHSDHEFQTPQQCFERFGELANAALGVSSDPINTVSVYLRELLRPIL